MAKNTGRGYRKGAVDNRSQFKSSNGNWVKRNTETGRIMDQKTSGGSFKGVRRED
ncbi:hypothetical protein [Psychrobacillus sp. NPDC096623]|uniref:hypothetical protein n=1 Tax=Psychrobacillus sp. NPDC096623 TaxID=3364492 RepID=UPI0037FA0341